MTKMVVEDLEQIISDTSAKLYNKRCYIAIGAAALFLVVACLGLLGAIIAIRSHGCSGNTEDAVAQARTSLMTSFCGDKSCLRTSAYLTESMDLSASPCDDFYQYACGGWASKHSVPPDRTKISVFDEMKERNEEKTREYLERRVTRTQHPVERKIKYFNRMCLHDYARIKDGGKKLVEMLKGNLKGWFVLEPHDWHDSWNFRDALITAHVDYDVPVLFDYDIWPQRSQMKKNEIVITPGGLGMSYRRFTRPQFNSSRSAYKDLMNKLGSLLMRDANVSLSEDEKIERLQQFVDDAYSVESQLAQMLANVDSDSRWTGTAATLSELSSNFTQIDWTGIMTQIFQSAGVTEGTEVVMRSTQYFQSLEAMLRNESDSRDRIMNNYITWSVLKKYARFLSWDYIKARYEHYEELTGRTEFTATWHACLDLVKSRFGLALASLYALRHVGADTKREIETMTSSIRTIALKRLNSYEWMDEETKRTARFKINSMTENIGFPNEFLDQSHLDEMYSHININRSAGFFWNLIESNKFKRFQLNYELKAGHSYSIWVYSFITSGYNFKPYYYWFFNSLMIPPSGMQFPMFDKGMPAAVNYGGMGSHIANALIKPYDEFGRYFLNGTFTNWWSSDTSSNFTKTKGCMQSYYQNQTAGPYLVDGVNQTVRLNPRMRLYSSLPHIGALHTAYMAYKDSTKSAEPGKPLIGINLTPDQVFFVAAAQMKCYVQQDDSAYRTANSGGIPGNMLVNAMVAHCTDFADVFKCKDKDKLQPNQRCQVY